MAMPAPTADLAAAAAPVTGLTDAQARSALARVGPNVLAEAEPPHWLMRFGRNFTHLFALLLWVGAVLALLGGQAPLAVAIVAVIVVNAIFSFAQEFRAERAAAALKQMLPQVARVRRDGAVTELHAEALVPGDVMLLSAGDKICADARLLIDVEFRVDMSALTGESDPIRRRVDAAPGGAGGLEATDRVFAGTLAVAGSAEAVVTATGMTTELGRIAGLTEQAVRHPSPLELEMGRMTRIVALLSASSSAG